MGSIFVRHGLSRPDGALPTEEWPLDPVGLPDISRLAEVLPSLPVFCSGMRRAVETAAFFGMPTIDVRLAEVERPFVADPKDDFSTYLSGGVVEGWESRESALARIEEAVADHGNAIYVTHGTILTLLVSSRCRDLDPHSFWAGLRNPDAWRIEGGQPHRVA